MEYKTAIVDELNNIIYWCATFSNEEIDKILEEHPEWRLQCIQVTK